MRAAAIFGLGCSPTELRPFQKEAKDTDWRIGLPAASGEVDVILLFGGDGTLHRHLSQLVKRAKPVLIVPAGSGNDFARALGLRTVRDSLRAWQGFSAGRENVHAIDLGMITPLSAERLRTPEAVDASARSIRAIPHYFCAVAGIGLDSEVARRANKLPRWLRGNGGYALTLAPTIFRFPPFPMKILAPDESGAWTTRSDRPTILAAFANSSTYGGGMKIAPHAKLDDGELDVCVITGIDPFKLFCLFPTVYFGRHLSIRGVEYFRSARGRIETETPLDVYADGEYVCQTPVEIATERAALRVIK
jgi:diacylglycerol kinase (ATP)